MPTTGFITVLDYSLEKSTTSLALQDISALNFGSVTQDLDEIKDAIETVIEGTILVAGFTKTYPEATTPPTSATAQRERKWLLSIQDTTQFLDAANTIANPGYQKIFTIEIPCAKIRDGATNLLVAGTDEADRTKTVIQNFITAIEANVRSPWNFAATNPTVKVLRMIAVGRNT